MASGCELVAPFPWFGGKRKVASLVWRRFSADVPNFVEPFAGSLAVLLGRPGGAQGIETANDADGHICNVFRAMRAEPEAMAGYAQDLAHEADVHAKHAHLVQIRGELTERLCGDPHYYDLELAGWWLYGVCWWIGDGWCSGNGPWQSVETPTGRKLINCQGSEGGVHRKRLHLGNAGRGVQRKLLHLGDAGQGVHRKRLHLGHAGMGVNAVGVNDLVGYLEALSVRLARVRICCGDWERVCGPTPTVQQGTTAVFLDPPYSAEAGRAMEYSVDCGKVAVRAREWCASHGDDSRLRIALAGYAGEGHEILEDAGWEVVSWRSHGGYGAGRGAGGDVNKHRERIWFSPHCLPAVAAQGRLFGEEEMAE